MQDLILTITITIQIPVQPMPPAPADAKPPEPVFTLGSIGTFLLGKNSKNSQNKFTVSHVGCEELGFVRFVYSEKNCYYNFIIWQMKTSASWLPCPSSKAAR